MKNIRKIVCLVLVAITLLAITVPAFAGTIVTPNNGRAKLWKYATSSGSEYVAYISSGNEATLKSSTASNGRYNVTAFGYNSANKKANYTGWINTAYYQN